MKTSVLTYAVAAAFLTLAGCSSAPRLDSAPIESRNNKSNFVSGSAESDNNVVTVNPLGDSSVNSQALRDIEKATNGLAKVFYFDYDSYSVKSDDFESIAGHARALNGNKAVKVRLTGHTDSRGGSEYNLSLGVRRADAVSKLFESQGVKASQVEVSSMGEEKPAMLGESEEAFEKNRRVELEYFAD